MTVDFTDYGRGLGEAVSVIRNNAMAAGLDAPVPTCPGWTVRDLVVHLGMVQRWATAVVSGTEPAAGREQAESACRELTGDVLDWLDDGLVALLNALAGAPPDLAVPFFLSNSPPPRTAWARRQCHEASVHAVDAMAARLGVPPAASAVWVSRELAVDGVDELLRGFLPRRSSRLRAERAHTVVVISQDTGDAWTIGVSQDPPVLTRQDAATAPAGGVTVRGGAVALYLALWNRGAEVAIDGPADWAAGWQEKTRVTWG